MFCTSPKRAEAAAIMYTLVETAKSSGADVYFYLKYLLEKSPSTPEIKVGRNYLVELMPWSKDISHMRPARKGTFGNGPAALGRGAYGTKTHEVNDMKLIN